MPNAFVNPWTGQATYLPSAPTRIDGSGLSSVQPAARGVGVLVYEAERGGEPCVPYLCDSAAALRTLLPIPIVEVLSRVAFTPATDAKVPGGFSRLIMVRANPATRAMLALLDAGGYSAADAAIIRAADWGLYGNDIQAKVETGTNAGKKFTVTMGDETQVVDDAGDMDAIDLLYTAPGATPPAGVVLTTLEVSVDPNAADGDPAVIVQFLLTVTGGTAAFDPRTWMAFDGNAADASGRLVFGCGAQGSEKTVIITGTRKDTGATVTDTITVGAAATTFYSTYAFSEVTSLDLSDLTGAVTVAGSAFALAKKTATGTPAYDTIRKVRDRIVSKGRGFSSTFQTATTGLAVADLDALEATTIKGATVNLPADLYDFVTKVGAGVSFVTVERATDAVGLPDNVSDTNLAGGSDGSADEVGDGGTTGWEKAEAALHAEALKPINSICVASTDPAVHVTFFDHIAWRNGKGEDEANLYLGVPGLTDKGTGTGKLYTLRVALANRNVNLFCQQIDHYMDRVVTTFEPWLLAMQVAAIENGRAKGTGVTRKYLNCVAVHDNPGTGAGNWTVENDAEALVANGYTLIATVPKGIRVLRGNTSYGQDTNPIFSSIVGNGYANLIAKGLRGRMEEFIGEENAAAPKAILERVAAQYMDVVVAAGQAVAYRNLEVVVYGDYFTTSVEVAPTEEYLWTPISERIYRQVG
jgi:hypothetical protein